MSSDSFDEALIAVLMELDQRCPPGEILPEQTELCPFCKACATHAEAERKLSDVYEDALPPVLARLPARLHWVLRAMIAHYESCPGWRMREKGSRPS
jgi:hypothetical protein